MIFFKFFVPMIPDNWASSIDLFLPWVLDKIDYEDPEEDDEDPDPVEHHALGRLVVVHEAALA